MPLEEFTDSDIEMIEQAKETCENASTGLAAESTISDVIEKLGGAAPIPLEEARREVQNGNFQEAAEHLDRLL